MKTKILALSLTLIGMLAGTSCTKENTGGIFSFSGKVQKGPLCNRRHNHHQRTQRKPRTDR